MPSYDFRCERCGPFSRVLPMREATGTSACPQCAAVAPRVFGAPALVGGATPIRRARAAAEASADTPQVVQRRPNQQPQPPRLPGRLTGLPRP
jgi:putative FmdB family regulatory protein